MAHVGVVRCSLSFPDPLWRSAGFVSHLLSQVARVRGASGLSAPGVFTSPDGTPTPDVPQGDPLALLSSRVTPMETCPALRPRWGPIHSPYRGWDCCLPVVGDRRLSPLHTVRDILLSTMIGISGLHHAACLLGPSSFVRPLLGMHVEFPTDLRVRLSSGGTGAVMARTHWVTTTPFMRVLSIPRFRAYLSATNNAFASVRSAVSNPSVNQLYTGASRSWASWRLPCCCHRRARVVAVRNSKDLACWVRAMPRACWKQFSASA